MGWAFWRRESKSTGEAATSAERGKETADPAAELRVRTRRRLVGAAALLLLSVFVLPMLLDPAPRPVPEGVTIKMPGQLAAVQVPQEPTPIVNSTTTTAPDPKPDEPPTETAAKPAEAATQPPHVAATASERFALQVAAMATVGGANQLAARLKKAGFVAYVEPVATAEGTRHRVRVGPFSSRDEAQRVFEKLRAAGFAAALVTA